MKDLTGVRSGLLQAIKCTGSRKNRKIWLCVCECGEYKQIASDHLVGQAIKSCGCLRRRKGHHNPKWLGCGEISSRFWTEIKHKASIRKYEFNITIKQAWDLFIKQEKRCSISGILLSMEVDRNNSASFRTASLDRIDNNKGYVLGNVQWVHKDINRMKWRYDQSYFIDLCKDIARYNT
jgi:hypothetical protein